MKKFALTALLIAGMASFSVNAATVQELEAEYQSIGVSIVDMINSRSVDAATVESKVLELTKLSVAISEQYKAKYPAGSKIIDIVINQVGVVRNGQVTALGPMASLSFKEIEDQWHDLGFVQTQDVGIDMDDEDNEHFTDPLHTMIHPIMVLRAARDYEKSKSNDDLDAMKGEMEEGMEQVAIIKGQF